MILVDTSVLIDALRSKDLRLLRQLRDLDAAICGVTPATETVCGMFWKRCIKSPFPSHFGMKWAMASRHCDWQASRSHSWISSLPSSRLPAVYPCGLAISTSG